MMDTTAQNPTKVHVAVNADFLADGTMLPRIITWEDGTEFTIDKVTNIRPAPAMKAVGSGDRYTIIIYGQQSNLFFKEAETSTVTTSVDGLLSGGN